MKIDKTLLGYINSYSKNIEKHKDQKSPTDNRGFAVTGVVVSGKIKRTSFPSTYCFSTFNHTHQPEAEAILLQIQPCNGDLNPEAYRNYIDWVVNKSPWEQVFVTKDIESILSTRVIVVDPEALGPYVMGGLQAVRDAWENHSNNGRYKQLNLWWDLVSKGADPRHAYSLTSNVILDRDSGICFGSNNLNHSPIGYLNNCATNFFINRQNKKLNKNVPWIESNSYSSTEIWNLDNNNDLNFLTNELFGKIDTKKSKINIFNDVAASYYNREKCIEALVNEMPTMEKKINATYA